MHLSLLVPCIGALSHDHLDLQLTLVISRQIGGLSREVELDALLLELP